MVEGFHPMSLVLTNKCCSVDEQKMQLPDSLVSHLFMNTEV